jgi:multidrug efflux pump subunit AcrB
VETVIGWFARRPLIVNLLMVLVFAMGYLTIADLRYEYNPKVDMGMVNITTVKAAAGPEEIELAITLPLEEELLEVEGVKKLYSNSMENVSVITLRLDLDAVGKHEIMRDIQQAVDRAAARLPPDLLERPRVEELSTLTTPIMELHVTGEVPEALLRSAARNIADGLREVRGVASIEKIGYRRPEVKIQLAPEKLARLGISHEEIIQAIRSRNIRESGGSLDSFLAEKKIVAVGQFQNPREVEDVVIRAREPGNAVLLRDVATVVQGFEDWELQSRVDGRMSIALQVRKKALADELHTAAAVREFADKVALPPGVKLVQVADISRLTSNMLDVLSGNALLGLVTVFVLLFYFLHARFALWVAVGIPFSICLAFLVLPAIGVTMNFMTLTGIIIVLGILVDDAVVVSDNTDRLRNEGLPPLQASVQGAAQVAQPVIFSAITTMLAFAPLMFMSGSTGAFLIPFPLAIIVLLLASLLESLCLLPAHLAHIPPTVQLPRRPAFERLRASYHRRIEKWLGHRWLTLCVFVLVFAAVLILGAARINFSLYPDVDIDTVQIKVELPIGSRFEETVAAVNELEQELRDLTPAEDLLAITSQIGHHDTNFYGATEGRNQSWALISVQLKPIGRRPADTNTYQLVEQLQAWADSRGGFRSLLVRAQDDLPVTGEPVEIEVISSGEERFTVADELLAYLQEHPGITRAWTSYTPGKDVIDLELNHALLVSRGLTVEQLIRALSVAVDGLLVEDLQTLDERVRYRLHLPPDRAGQLSFLENMTIINQRGEAVHLNAVASPRLRPGESNIKHYFGKRTVTVFAEIDSDTASLAGVNAEIAAWMAAQDWLQRYPFLRVHQGGELEEQTESLEELGLAALICIISIFGALVILFNSVTQPLLILVCIPFGLVGVVLCYALQGMSMGMMAFTGVIGLVGVLVNDSLVLMHALNGERSALGRMLSAAEVAAVGRRRFRPIFITSITTAAGLFPTAYGIMGENSYIQPMVMSMAWGVAFGGLVSLVLLPVLYMIEQDLRARAAGALRRASKSS